MANDARGRARGGTNREANVRIATPRRGVGVEREAVAAESISFPLLVAIIHLAIVQGIATLVYTRGTANPTAIVPFGLAPSSLSGVADTIVGPMTAGDGLWYRLIATRGYDVVPSSAAFWPLFPWLMHVVAVVTGLAPEIVGYAVANLAFIGALILLYQLISFDFDREIARRTLVVLACAPLAFVFSAVYAESLFLLLGVAALYAARQDQWFAAGLYGVLAALTHWQGVLLVVPFAIVLIQQYGFDPRRVLPNLPAVLLPMLGPIIFGWQLTRAGYGWLSYYDVQERWNRHPTWPWRTVQHAWSASEWGWVSDLAHDPTWTTVTSSQFRLAFSTSGTLDLIALMVIVVLAVIGLGLLPLYQSAIIWPALLVALVMPAEDYPLESLPRFGLVFFPLIVVVALLIRHRRFAIPAVAISIVILVALTAQFAQGYWIP